MICAFCFCLKCSNSLNPCGSHLLLLFFWTQTVSAVYIMLLTVFVDSWSCLTMNSFIDSSELSMVGYSIPGKTRLSFMVCVCKSTVVSIISLFTLVTEVSWLVSVLTDCCNVCFSCVQVSYCTCLNSRLWQNAWNYLCIISISKIMFPSVQSLY